MSVTPDDFYQAAELSELTAEELLRRADAMEARGKQLLAQASNLNAVAAGLAINDSEETTEHNRWGQDINVSTVIAWVQEHSPFTRREFEEGLKLSTAQASKWLARLRNNKPHPIVIYVVGARGRASIYEYNTEFAPNPTSRPEHARAIEASAGVGADAPARGAPAQYTGRPMGSSGKPGLDKRRSKTRRVRRDKGNVMGGR